MPYSYDNSSVATQSAQDVPTSHSSRAAMRSGYPQGTSEQGDNVSMSPGQGTGCASCRNGGSPGGAPCGSCDGSCDDSCEVDGDWRCDANFFLPCNRLWFSADYLAWWGKLANLPPLVTTSPATTPRSQAGVLGQPGTTILFGASNVDPGVHSGARFSVGYWLSSCRDEGLEVTYMSLGKQSASFDQTSQGDPILARPFFNVQTALQDSVIVAIPSQQKGTIHVGIDNELSMLEVLYRQACLKECDRELDLLFGYRYGWLAENFGVNESTTFTSTVGQIPSGTVIAVSDGFAASNEFNGAEVGIATKAQCCRWSFDMMAKLAMGNTRSRVTIDGATTVTAPSQTPVTHTGGVLALPTNIGTYERNSFSAIPEVGATVGYDLTCHLRATVGYTLLYWSQVARPGDQIDTNLNPSQFPPGRLSGISSPQFKFVTTDYWAQGLNVGLDYRF
jgi:hypothetical protein